MGMSITIRALDELSVSWITQKAKQRGVSLEEIIVQLIHESIGVERSSSELKWYNDLDSLAGTWNDEEFDEFLQVIADFNQVDEQLWQ
jgi:hypothetical protein